MVSHLSYFTSSYGCYIPFAIFLRCTDKGTICFLHYVDDMIIISDDLNNNDLELNAQLSIGEPLPNFTLYQQLVCSLLYLSHSSKHLLCCTPSELVLVYFTIESLCCSLVHSLIF